MARIRPKLVVAGLGAVLLVGGAAFAIRMLNRPAPDRAVALVPAGAVFYATLFVDPSVDQKRAIQGLAERFPGIGSADKVEQGAAKLLEEPAQEAGLSFEDDVAPWLGDQAAVFVVLGAQGDLEQAAGGAALIATTDIEASGAAVEKALAAENPGFDTTAQSYEGVDYGLETGAPADEAAAYGFVEDFLVVGNERGFEAVVDSSLGEPNLGDSEEYLRVTGGLNDDHLALGYADTSALLDAAEQSGDLTQADRDAIASARNAGSNGPSAFGVWARSDALILEGANAIPGDGPLADLWAGPAQPGFVPELPSGAWLALGAPSTGATVRAFIEATGGMGGEAGVGDLSEQLESATGLSLEDDFISWMGDGGVFVRGTNVQELDAGGAIESSDSATTIETIQKIQTLLEEEGAPVEPASRAGGYAGFSVQLPGAPAPVTVLGGPRLVVAYGERATDDLTAPAETLAGDDRFVKAGATLGDGYSTSVYIDVQATRELSESVAAMAGATDSTYETDVKPYLEPLSHVIAGVRIDGQVLLTRIVVGTN